MYPQNQGFLPSPINTAQAKWVCPECSALNEFIDTSRSHPLGRMECLNCNAVAKDSEAEPIFFERTDVPKGFIRLPSRFYKLSVPPALGLRNAPHSVIVWACCCCGESHTLMPCLPPQTKRDGSGFLRPFHMAKCLNLGHKSTRGAKKPEDASVRLIFTAHFTNSCERCRHTCCETCFRGALCDQNEWLVRDMNDSEITQRQAVAEKSLQERRRASERGHKHAWGYG
ncbi:hypothetical protein P280DRAFT_477730 [Massarina eburnea CBS 473.64]|uniref:Uncharacterized protein n=1 Tax=Massarina eburnea CBS 473.64 TaxID=1395130 RepID=A0A6A6S9T8_9PLEO|nr:hypothetical protein P280DRAFT_477730 [Massarina eburnea CBS 473.64]